MIGPTIGIDFDNTIVDYNLLMYRIAHERGLLQGNLPGDGPDRPVGGVTKRSVRDRVRQLPGGEIEWQKIQALAYGPLMRDARPADGAESFIRRCRDAGMPVFIVSHKTAYAAYDETKTNLRDAALEWMAAHRFFEPGGLDLTERSVYFESTRADKIARIGAIGCAIFIDDLEEVFLDASFPPGVTRILYEPGSWPAIHDRVFGSGA